MNLVNQLRHSRRVTGLFKNGLSIPMSISLAISGLSVQLYASYNLVTSGNEMRFKIPYFSNYQLEDSTS